MSIPTSLIFVILIAAWLAVLVPMVARRREAVPETESDGSTFRVLRRASASVRRRPKLAERDELEEDDLMADQDRDDSSDEFSDDEDLHEELLDQDEPDEDDFDDDQFEDAPEPQPIRVGRRSKTVRARAGSEPVAVVQNQGYAGYAAPQYPAAHYQTADYQTAEYERAEYQTEEYQAVARSDSGMSEAAFVGARGPEFDDPHLRPIPRRHGRGGYDPDAAEMARAYRYSRRRRVTVVLLVATLVFSLAAYFVEPIMWSGAAVSGLLLIAYLGYLRRQVHIEADIRERRQARLARARQIRPEYPALHDEMPLQAAPFAAAASQVPPAGYRNGRQIVDLEDDDPSFDDLDYYQPISYRRASGQ